MTVAGMYSFKEGKAYIEERYPILLREILSVIKSVRANRHITKVSKEKTMPGKRLFNPSDLPPAIRTLTVR
jgi:hypothetical protein